MVEEQKSPVNKRAGMAAKPSHDEVAMENRFMKGGSLPLSTWRMPIQTTLPHQNGHHQENQCLSGMMGRRGLGIISGYVNSSSNYGNRCGGSSKKNLA